MSLSRQWIHLLTSTSHLASDFLSKGSSLSPPYNTIFHSDGSKHLTILYVEQGAPLARSHLISTNGCIELWRRVKKRCLNGAESVLIRETAPLSLASLWHRDLETTLLISLESVFGGYTDSSSSDCHPTGATLRIINQKVLMNYLRWDCTQHDCNILLNWDL